MLQRIKDDNGRGTSYHIFKYCVVADYQNFSCDDLRIVGRNYRNKMEMKNCQSAVNYKNLKPFLNVQEKSVALKLITFLRESNTDEFSLYLRYYDIF